MPDPNFYPNTFQCDKTDAVVAAFTDYHSLPSLDTGTGAVFTYEMLSRLTDKDADGILVPAVMPDGLEGEVVIQPDERRVFDTKFLSDIRARAVEAAFGTAPLRPETRPEELLVPMPRLGEQVVIHSGVRLGPNIVVGSECSVAPRARIVGRSVLADRVRVGDSAQIKGSRLGTGTRIASGSTVERSQLGRQTEVGSRSQVTKTTTEENVTIGRSAKVEAGTRINSGLSVGDHTTIGKRVHVGAGIGHFARVDDDAVIEQRIPSYGRVSAGEQILRGAPDSRRGRAPEILDVDGIIATADAAAEARIAAATRSPYRRHFEVNETRFRSW